jgi:transposase
MKSGKRYDHAFKLEAIKLVTDRGMSKRQVAKDLGMTEQTLSTWMDKYGKNPEKAEAGEFAEEEIRRLRKEVETLKMERDILKKATVVSIGRCNTFYFVLAFPGIENESQESSTIFAQRAFGVVATMEAGRYNQCDCVGTRPKARHYSHATLGQWWNCAATANPLCASAVVV